MNKVNEYKSKKLIRIYSNKKLFFSMIMLFIFIMVVVFGALIAPFTYNEMNTNLPLSSPSKYNFFGTDQYGRDLFSRVIYGARYSLLIAFSVVLFSNVIGILIGSIAGYVGGKFDIFAMRLVDIIFSIPWILLAMIVTIFIGAGIKTVIIALSIIYSPQIARIVRGVTLQLKEKEFVEAGKISGESTLSILLKYILANSLAPILVQSAMVLAYTILAEAALSYLGYGVMPPLPSWGLLLLDATKYYNSNPNLIYFPGFAIVFAVLSFSFLGDGLRDLLDPKFNPLG